MKLTNIEIKNFRGIKHASVFFPLESRIICLIGAGDSGKSTLLTAIEWVLWPSWSLIATDTDFYNSDTTTPIEITVSITELPKLLMKEDKFGLFLRDFVKVCHGGDDEPTESGTTILTIQLTIDDTLEPKWNVITSRTDPKPITQKDRRLLSFGVVGFDYEKDFQWGRGSVLQKYADSREALHSAFTQAMRAAVENTSLEALDQMAPTLKDVGENYGVGFNGEIHNRLLMQNGSYSTTVGVFDDKVPFAQRGLGSKRLLSIGMNVNACDDGTLVLVDEVETGLEPYRISALINQFRTQFKDHGQLIMTTHSRSVVCECGVDELCVVNNEAGELKIHQLG
ncbi:MAG: AAA family ATPase, partial [Oribacterium sp.]|nr:AAA family ATPase [Oribacterium sp.]